MGCDTVFVRSIPDGTNKEELKELFAQTGPVRTAFIVVHKDGPKKGQSKGYGFVRYSLSDDAAEAAIWASSTADNSACNMCLVRTASNCPAMSEASVSALERAVTATFRL